MLNFIYDLGDLTQWYIEVIQPKMKTYNQNFHADYAELMVAAIVIERLHTTVLMVTSSGIADQLRYLYKIVEPFLCKEYIEWVDVHLFNTFIGTRMNTRPIGELQYITIVSGDLILNFQ